MSDFALESVLVFAQDFAEFFVPEFVVDFAAGSAEAFAAGASVAAFVVITAQDFVAATAAAKADTFVSHMIEVNRSPLHSAVQGRFSIS